MRISVLKEIKPQEERVGLTPANVVELIHAGHEVFIEKNAGIGSGFSNEEYQINGAIIVDAKTAWNKADMVIKVKEPIESEYQYFREGLIIYTYFHLASNEILTRTLLNAKVISIAYETVELKNHTLPLLTPMSEIAGRMAIQIAAHFCEKHQGGNGVLLGGIPGIRPGKIVIVGGGVVGMNAAKMAIGMGAEVVIFDKNLDRVRYLDTLFGNTATVLTSSELAIAEETKTADVVIGAVLIPGAVAPKVVTKEMVTAMKPGSVIIDVAIDQGGCIETTDRYTTHEHPTYLVDGVIHYAVANMPGAVARTSTIGLTNTTAKYAAIIANVGYKEAINRYPELAKGLNTEAGKIIHPGVQTAFPHL